MGDERGSTDQSALPPAFYRCPAEPERGGEDNGEHTAAVSHRCGPKRSWWLDIGRAPSRSMVTEIALHYDPLIVRYLFVPDPIARLLAARLR